MYIPLASTSSLSPLSDHRVLRSRSSIGSSTTTFLSFLLVSSLATSAVLAHGLPDNAANLSSVQLLSLATSALSSGKSISAIQIYDHLLERDPEDLATLYKRSSVRFALGQWNKAKEGFQQVLENNPGFGEARIKLGRCLAKLGEYELAKKQLKQVEEEQEVKILLKSIWSAETATVQAEKATQLKRWNDCVTQSTSALEFSPNSEPLRLLRSNCYLHANEFDSAVGDLTRASTLTTALPDWLMIRLSIVSAFLIENTESSRELNPEGLAAIKKCLNADPDSKSCRKLFKLLKTLDKDLKSKWKSPIEGSKWLESSVGLNGSPASPGLIKRIEDLFEIYSQPLKAGGQSPLPTDLESTSSALAKKSPLYRHALSDLCRSYLMLGRTMKAVSACEASLAANPEDVWGLVGRGDKLLSEDNFDEAVRVYNDAFEKTGKSDREVLGRLQKAQRLLKQSKSKDYYKVLGVSRDADAKTIKRAYRKATLKAHPDKEGGSEEKMAALNEAYEVLSKPELRQRFDNGDDPNDQQSGGGQGHPFFHQGGGFQFQGGGFEQFFQQAQGQNGHTHTFRFG